MNESEKVFIDSNVLIYHTFADSDQLKHQKAHDSLTNLFEKGYEIYLSHQILREFFAIATNSRFFQQELSVEQAILKLNEFEQTFYLVSGTLDSFHQLKFLLNKYKITRQNIHDCNIVATMIGYHIKKLFTFNVRDFQRYEEIELFNLNHEK